MTSADSRQPQCPEEKGARGPVDLCSARTGAERRMVDSRKVKVDFSLEDMDLSEFLLFANITITAFNFAVLPTSIFPNEGCQERQF